MKTITVKFINRPNPDGTVTGEISVAGCLIAQHGAATAPRPQILIHLPKSFEEDVKGAWVTYEGNDYHVVGVTVKNMDANTPTSWNRYAIAEKIY